MKGFISGKPLADVSSNNALSSSELKPGVRRKDVTKEMSKFFCIRVWWFTIGTFWLNRHSDKSLQTIQWSKFLQHRFNALSSLSTQSSPKFFPNCFCYFRSSMSTCNLQIKFFAKSAKQSPRIPTFNCVLKSPPTTIVRPCLWASSNTHASWS